MNKHDRQTNVVSIRMAMGNGDEVYHRCKWSPSKGKRNTDDWDRYSGIRRPEDKRNLKHPQIFDYKSRPWELGNNLNNNATITVSLEDSAVGIHVWFMVNFQS